MNKGTVKKWINEAFDYGSEIEMDTVGAYYRYNKLIKRINNYFTRQKTKVKE